MTELHATVDERAAAAMAAHTYAWRRQRQAAYAHDPVTARFWADTCAACLAELDELAAAGRATRGLHGVYVDDRMDLRVISTTSTRQRPRSDTELVGTYRRGALVEHIEDDLIAFQQELTGQRS